MTFAIRISDRVADWIERVNRYLDDNDLWFMLVMSALVMAVLIGMLVGGTITLRLVDKNRQQITQSYSQKEGPTHWTRQNK